MLNKAHKIIVKKAKEEYKRIGKIKCPAFDNELIHFNQKGFRHLLMKTGKYRTISEQARRLNLIPKIMSVISTASNFYSYRKDFGIDFWSISKVIDGVLIIVVIRQDGVDKPKYFLSVMDKLIHKNAKAP
jgi:hypothetical protein